MSPKLQQLGRVGLRALRIAGCISAAAALIGVPPLCVDGCSSNAMTPELASSVLEGLLQLHEELSVDPDAPWYVGTPDQTQVLHDELWILAGELLVSSGSALVEAWYVAGRSALLPVHCSGELVSSRHQHAA